MPWFSGMNRRRWPHVNARMPYSCAYRTATRLCHSLVNDFWQKPVCMAFAHDRPTVARIKDLLPHCANKRPLPSDTKPPFILTLSMWAWDTWPSPTIRCFWEEAALWLVILNVRRFTLQFVNSKYSKKHGLSAISKTWYCQTSKLHARLFYGYGRISFKVLVTYVITSQTPGSRDLSNRSCSCRWGDIWPNSPHSRNPIDDELIKNALIDEGLHALNLAMPAVSSTGRHYQQDLDTAL